jgi:peptidoglycan/LPS O-acetylase OafA/YrhL
MPSVASITIPDSSAVRPASPSSPPGEFHIPSLDGVRALAFLMVFVSHAGLKDLVPGGFGVTIFFVLSGFLITTLLRLEFEKNGNVDLGAFYLRRAFRILPLMYLTLAGAILLGLAGQLKGTINWAGILSQSLYWTNYYLIANGPNSLVAGAFVLWSLAVEEHFYLFFPPIFRIMNKKFTPNAQGWFLASACAACLVWRLVLIVVMHRPTVRAELGTDTRFDSLLFGCLMAIVANPVQNTPRWLTLDRIRRAAMLAVPVLLFTLLYRNEAFRYTWRYTLQNLALLPLFCYVIKDRGSLVFKILNFRWMTQLGVLSYALYLIHAIVLEWFSNHLTASTFVIGIATLAISLVIAKILQLWIERPSQRLRKRFVRIQQVTPSVAIPLCLVCSEIQKTTTEPLC